MKIKSLWKKVCTLSLAAVIGTGLIAGCGNSGGSVTMESPDGVPADPYEINWYMVGTYQDGVEAVEQKINEYLKDKINATVKLHILETAQYKDKLTNMIQTGEYFDLCFTATWMLDYAASAENGAFVEMDEMFEKYMPKTYETIDKGLLDGSKVNGKYYCLPVIKENSQSYGWIYRKDLADKYGIDMSKIKTFEELEPVLKTIKENEPDITYPIDWSGDTSPSGGMSRFEYLDNICLGLDHTKDSYEVVNKLELPRSLEQYKLARKFYEEGLVKQDILTNNSDSTQRLKNGQTFCIVSVLKPGKAEESFGDSKYEIAQEYVTPIRQKLNAGSDAAQAISATSKNPARVAKFLELLNTDKYLHNLVVFGIENVNYKKVSDNVVELIPDSGYDLSKDSWKIGNVFINYTTTKEDPEKYEKIKEFDESAEVNELNGFRFKTEAVQGEIAACTLIAKQYGAQCSLGAVDPEPILVQYKAELEKSGINKIKEELQNQLDEFLASKNN